MVYEIGQRIRKFRELRNISQKDFAAKIGVSSSRVSNWEQGTHRPDVDILGAVCTALNVSPSELLDIHLSDEELNEHEHQLIMAYRKHCKMQHAVDVLLGLDSI